MHAGCGSEFTASIFPGSRTWCFRHWALAYSCTAVFGMGAGDALTAPAASSLDAHIGI
jgi:hypothetical protein